MVDITTIMITEEQRLLNEAHTLMDNIHAYDSEISGKIEATLNGMNGGTKYATDFINGLLSEAMDLFENCHADETEIYFELEKRLK